MGDVYAAQGLYHEAIAAYERAGAMHSAVAGQALAYGLSGKRDVSQKLLDDLEKAIQQGSPGAAAWIARTFAQLGEKDLAFEYLEKAYEDCDAQVVWLRVDPFFEQLRSDPRCDVMLRRMNLLR
jgi:adenylate cyclase